MGTLSSYQFLQRLAFFFLVFTTIFCSSSAGDTMDGISLLRDGETLVSAGGSFEVGFSGVGAAGKRYLCIRSNKGQEKPIVWVANHQRPLADSSGILKFGGDGNLIVVDGAGETVWSTELPPNMTSKSVARLLESGNLVVGVGRPEGFLWQSFDKPGDTLLPGMQLLVDTRTGASRHLTSWKSADDPSPGRYSYRLELAVLTRLVLREGSTIKFSAGLWNGIRFTGGPALNANGVINSSVVSSGDVVYYTDRLIRNSSLLRLVLTPSGTLQRLVWEEETGQWRTLWSAPGICERFGICGLYGACAEGTCRCLRGFRPKSLLEWSLGNGTDGCVRETRLDCGGGNVFLPVPQVKLPELSNSSTVSMWTSLEECHDRCARDCSCTAYAGADVREGGKGCITWSGDLVDIRSLSRNGQELYLRVAASQLGDFRKKKAKRVALVVSLTAALGVVVLTLCGLCLKRKTKKNTVKRKNHHHEDGEDSELPLFDFATIMSATNNLSINNKIGEGGFGIVYKGTLEDGQEVAVKRLSWTSVQGVDEFMNEVKLIVKLQHKNLVRILGCCFRENERMLIYEYMANKSLDSFIFDETKSGLLDWRRRLDIILGVARGLMYLHHDSRFKIIHRDLKAGNILLDGAMNPKISDFGTARIFGADQQIEKTKRVIGTYGYMSPEYAMNGIISTKSDIFSFGVLILEVLSGIRSRVIDESKPHVNLLSHAWKLWQEGNSLQLLDPTVKSSYQEIDLLRCIKVGLLCVQEHANERPTMIEVIMMLGSESFPLPQPKKPGFIVLRSPSLTAASSSKKKESSSVNEMDTTSILDGR